MTREGYTENCTPECFEFGGTVGCPGWTCGRTNRPTTDIAEPQPSGAPAYARSRQRPSLTMGVVEGGNLPRVTVDKIAARWGGMVVIPRLK